MFFFLHSSIIYMIPTNFQSFCSEKYSSLEDISLTFFPFFFWVDAIGGCQKKKTKKRNHRNIRTKKKKIIHICFLKNSFEKSNKINEYFLFDDLMVHFAAFWVSIPLLKCSSIHFGPIETIPELYFIIFNQI